MCSRNQWGLICCGATHALTTACPAGVPAAAGGAGAGACCMVVAAQHGASAFQPYINHLVGQSSQRRASAHQDPAGPSSGGGSTASSTITLSGKPFSASGILGCISSQDWAVRRAAADAVRALVLLVGPELEPEDCWGLGDPGSVTGRCLNALEDCRFDKVGTTLCMAASSTTRLRNSVREASVDAHAPEPASMGAAC